MILDNTLENLETESTDWQPTASLDALRARALLFQEIRSFFKERCVLEVETPLLCHAAIQDPHLHPIPALYLPFGTQNAETLYLQTSPEFAMKRLLAFGVGAMYQLCKAFRNGESGRLHNPEFTILEWYQPGYDHYQLMDEVELFLSCMIHSQKAERITYRNLFLKFLDLDPFQAEDAELQAFAEAREINIGSELQNTLTRDDWLNLLMTHCIEPSLGFEGPVMVYDFPASQAALAKINTNEQGFKIAERFEVYIEGMELANGYHELTDGLLQEQRFQEDARVRQTLDHPEIPIDIHLVSALNAGMPDCAGVALGVDRLLMLKQKSKDIKEVLAFTIDRA